MDSIKYYRSNLNDTTDGDPSGSLIPAPSGSIISSSDEFINRGPGDMCQLDIDEFLSKILPEDKPKNNHEDVLKHAVKLGNYKGDSSDTTANSSTVTLTPPPEFKFKVPEPPRPKKPRPKKNSIKFYKSNLNDTTDGEPSLIPAPSGSIISSSDEFINRGPGDLCQLDIDEFLSKILHEDKPKNNHEVVLKHAVKLGNYKGDSSDTTANSSTVTLTPPPEFKSKVPEPPRPKKPRRKKNFTRRKPNFFKQIIPRIIYQFDRTHRKTYKPFLDKSFTLEQQREIYKEVFANAHFKTCYSHPLDPSYKIPKRKPGGPQDLEPIIRPSPLNENAGLINLRLSSRTKDWSSDQDYGYASSENISLPRTYLNFPDTALIDTIAAVCDSVETEIADTLSTISIDWAEPDDFDPDDLDVLVLDVSADDSLPFPEEFSPTRDSDS